MKDFYNIFSNAFKKMSGPYMNYKMFSQFDLDNNSLKCNVCVMLHGGSLTLMIAHIFSLIMLYSLRN